jgi:hypothetical protein
MPMPSPCFKVSDLSSDFPDILLLELRDEDDNEAVGHLVLGHVVEHGLQCRLQVALAEGSLNVRKNRRIVLGRWTEARPNMESTENQFGKNSVKCVHTYIYVLLFKCQILYFLV